MSTCAYCTRPLRGHGRRDRRYCTDACRTAASRERQASQSRDNVAGLTQVERVARMLRQRGPDGIDETDFDAPHVRDGGEPIRRLAARIKDLRLRGWEITTHLVGPAKVARYVMVSGPALPAAAAPSAEDIAEARRALHDADQFTPAPAPAAAAPAPAALFDDLVGVAPPRSALDPFADA